MTSDWLWDRKLSAARAKAILKDADNKNFILLAALLLARKNEPAEVFAKYLKPEIFCAYWPVIKKAMRRNRWDEPRIIYWQSIYENLLEKFHKKGVAFRKAGTTAAVKDEICESVGQRIRDARKELGLSQRALAKKIGVSQQVISRIEKGRENISLITLKNVISAFGRKVSISIS